MQIWIDEMISSSVHTASFKFYDSTSEMAADFNADKLDYVIAYGLEFVKYFDKSKLVDGFSGGMLNRSDENIVIVAPYDTDLESIQKITNPIIVLQKSDNISKLYAELNITKDKKVIFLETKKRSGAILKLFFKKADIAIVVKKTFDFAVELNPQVGKKLKILEYSNIPAGSFGYFRKGFDTKIKDEMTEMAFKLTDDERGRQMLTMFQTNELVKIKVEDLEPIEKLYTEYISLKKGKK